MSTVTWRAYQANDLDACLAIFQSNQQPFFASDEYAEYEEFLKHEVNAKTSPYYVMLKEHTIVGCGGYMCHEGTAFLTWGMLERGHHGQGLGRELVRWRIRQLQDELGDMPVAIVTSQHTAPIYQRLGFIEKKRKENGFGPGLDAVRMQLAQ